MVFDYVITRLGGCRVVFNMPKQKVSTNPEAKGLSIVSSKKMLLKANEIRAMVGERRVHHLNPNAIRNNKSLGDAVGMKNLGVHIITVAPGLDTTEYHMHHREDEFVLILEGSGLATIDQDQYNVEAWDFLGFPAGTAAHSISNTGSTNLVCLVGGLRLDFEICDYPLKQKRLYMCGEMRNLVDYKDIENNNK